MYILRDTSISDKLIDFAQKLSSEINYCFSFEGDIKLDSGICFAHRYFFRPLRV